MRGRDLRALRTKAPRITQRELRERLEWDANKIVKIENEDVLPKPEDEEAYILAVSRMRAEREEMAAA